MKTSVLITAIVCITALEALALYMGFNGTLLKLVLILIAGLSGYELKVLKGGK